MKPPRAFASRLGRLALGALSAVACGDPAEPEAEREAAVLPCGDVVARSHGDLSLAAPLCDTHHLVARLSLERPDTAAPAAPVSGVGRLAIPLRVTKTERREYCFVDDNGEAHAASLRDVSGREVLALTAGAPCAVATLRRGDYALTLIHEGADREGATDDTPDIVHTRLAPSALPGVGAKFQILVNACPGCDLRGVVWPRSEEQAYGFVGDYAGVDFSGSVCRNAERVKPRYHCELSGRGAGFDGATLRGVSIADGAELVLSGSFRDLVLTLAGGSIVVRDAVVSTRERPTLGVSGASLLQSTVDAWFLTEFLAVKGNALTKVAVSPSATGYDDTTLDFDHVVSRLVAPTTKGVVDLHGMSFRRAVLTSPRFSTNGDAVNLAGSDFSGAVLLGGSLDGANLDRASFDGASLSGISAAGASFGRAQLTNLKRFEDLVATNANFDYAELSLAPGVSARGLIAVQSHWRHAQAAKLSAPSARLVDADLSNANLSGADLAGASFVGALLDETRLDGSVLAGANFTGARGTDTNLGAVRARGAAFTRSRLWGASLLNADLEGASAVGAVLCGSKVDGLLANGADLTSALLLADSNIHVIDGQPVVCDAVIPSPSVIVTNKDTRCPSGVNGACAGDAWTSVDYRPVCCVPGASGCPRRKAEKNPCTTACDCASLICTASLCSP